MKDFRFSKSMKIVQEGSLEICSSLAVRRDGVVLHTANGFEYSEDELLKIINEQTVFFVTAMLENQLNIKKLCEMIERGDIRLHRALDNRSLIKQIVDHAQNEFLTDVLTREVKI